MTELPLLPDTTIRDFAAVPAFRGRALIRLPRCGKCYGEVHDYQDGRASCIPTPGQYAAMDPATLTDWSAAEEADARTQPLDRDSDNPSEYSTR